MTQELFRDNCKQCAALCCVALAFDKSNLFGIDKAAGEPCRHLNPKKPFCTIHDHKTSLGFKGCLLYSCHGAGQRVVQECFEGRSWQSDPKLITPMLKAFEQAKKVHEMLLLLSEAQKLPLNLAQQAQSKALVAALTPNNNMTEAWLTSIKTHSLETKLHQFLKSLKSLVKKR